MGLLSIITRIQDAAGNQLGVVRNDGTRAPIALELGDGLSAVARQNGATDIVRLEAETGSALNTLHVRAAAAGDVTLASASTGQDGLTMVEGDRILLAYQATPLQNGLYVYGTVSAGHAALTRTPDFDSSSEAVYGAQVAVSEGTLNGGSVWQHVTTGAITLGSTALLFHQLSNRGDGVFLTNADQVLSVAGGRKYTQSTGAPASDARSKTLSATGAAVNDSITIVKKDRTSYPIRIFDHDGSTAIGVLAVQGSRMTFRYNGTNWELHEQHIDTTGWPVFNVRNYLAQGDERWTVYDPTTEAAKIQAAIDDAATYCRDPHMTGAIVRFPSGNYRTDGHPLIWRRTPYARPMIFEGEGNAGISNATGVGTAGDVFRVETMVENPSVLHGGEQHVIRNLALSGKHFCINWDLGAAADSLGDGVRPSILFQNLAVSRTTTPGPCIYVRHASRCLFDHVVVDPSIFCHGVIGVSMFRGSFSVDACRGGGALLQARDCAEIWMARSRCEGGRQVPGCEFRNVIGLHMASFHSEGHDEASAILYVKDSINVTIDNAIPATPDRSSVQLTGLVAITGTPDISFVHVDPISVVGSFEYAAENKIVRSAGSWPEDMIGPSSHVKVNGSSLNDEWFDVIAATHDTLWVLQTVANESLSNCTGSGTMIRLEGTLQPNLVFDNHDGQGRITRSAGSWVVDGFAPGQIVRTASPTLANQGPLTVASVSATQLLVSETLTVETLSQPDDASRLFVRADKFAHGILLEHVQGFHVRNAQETVDFSGQGDLSARGIKVDADCRDGVVEMSGFGSTSDIDIDAAAYNVIGQYHSHSSSPGTRITFWHGKDTRAALDLQSRVLPLRAGVAGAPGALCGLSVRRSAVLGDESAAAMLYDETVFGWKDCFTDNETSVTSLLDRHSKRFIGPTTDNAQIVAQVGRSVIAVCTSATPGDLPICRWDKPSSEYCQTFFGNTKISTSGYISIEASAQVQFVAGTTVDLYGGGVLQVRAASAGLQLHRISPLSSPATGTGISTEQNGQVRRSVHRRAFGYQAFSDASTSKAIKFDALPAKTRVLSVVAETGPTPFSGGAISAVACQVGTEDDPDAYIVSHDVFTVAVVKGLADADMGVELARATIKPGGGHVPSWTLAKELRVQLDSTGGNLNTLTGGTVTVTVVVEYLGT